MGAAPVRWELPRSLELTAAAPLAAALLALRGKPLVVDASKVDRLGGLCLQVILAARLTWRSDGLAFSLVEPSPSFDEAWRLFGAPALSP